MNPNNQEEKVLACTKYLSKEIKNQEKKNNVHDLLHKVIYKAEKEKFGSERALVLYSTMLEITNEFCT